MNTTKMGYAMSVLAAMAFAASTGCATGVESTDDESIGQGSQALINNGGLGANGDACTITGGPNKDKTGTRDGNYCCTEPNGGGHCQDCTTPSDWCSDSVRVKGRFGGIVAAPIATVLRSP